MDKKKVKELQEAIAEALRAVEAKVGVKISKQRLSYTPEGTFTVTIRGGAVGADGTVATREAEDFKLFAQAYGLKADQLGAEFRYGGDVYAVAGLNTRKDKNPVLAKRKSNGKTYLFPSDAVAKLLASPS